MPKTVKQQNGRLRERMQRTSQDGEQEDPQRQVRPDQGEFLHKVHVPRLYPVEHFDDLAQQGSSDFRPPSSHEVRDQAQNLVFLEEKIWGSLLASLRETC